jgi:hypothetical protein
MKLLPLLDDLPDQRTRKGRRYDLPHILLFTVLAMLSGANSYRTVTAFIEERFAVLQALCNINWRRPPAHTTLRAILGGLDQNALEEAFRQHAATISALPADAVIAIDGKTLRGSFDHALELRALIMVSAFATDDALSLAHIMLDDSEKLGEIPAVQQLIEQLNLRGKLYSLDALHCQKNSGNRSGSRE